MKIIKQILFSVIGIIIFGLVMNLLIKNSVLRDFKVDSDKAILVFGDSHAECNFYDVDNEIQNFGVRSEAPNFTLLKAKHLLQSNNGKHVIITLSPHNISTWREKRYYERDSSAGMISKYWSLIDHKYLLDNYSDLPLKTSALLHLKKITGAPNIESSFLIKDNFKGGFYRDKDTTVLSLKSVKKSFQRHFDDDHFKDINYDSSSKKFKKYYKELISFVASTDAKVVVIGTPIHSSYLDMLSQEQYANYKSFLLKIKEEYPNTQILDYTELDLPDHYFLDSDHLNFRGAKYFTQLLIKEIIN
ncbi:MAG: hypothetical protein ACJA2M_002447 [Polaribacter sp.]|jgi:hypothetical protein